MPCLLDTLFQEIEILKRQVVSQPQSVENHAAENDNAHDTDLSHDGTQQSLQSSKDAQRDLSVDTADEKTETSPAMSTGPWFDSMNIFKSPVLIGEAADAAFATRFRQVIADPSTPEPTHLLRLNHATNESLMSLVDVNVPWPSPSRAKFLLEAAMRYIGFLFHDSEPTIQIREHRKRLFWTAFVLDRIFASKLNHPPAIQDDDIDLDLPSEIPTPTPSDSFGDAEYHVANVTLARLLSSIIRSVYSVRKQAEGTCADVSSRAQACLNDLQSWYEALPRRFQIDDKSLDDHHELQIVSLHLRFYQVVPLLMPYPLPRFRSAYIGLMLP
ncbi:hypothetical protein SLS64_011583 [Diaporthe eres]